ncbi:hypothetical protein [Streptomyces sp. H27-H5]|uniref:hypothetical protein n=2 Tax=unclassified Streptomyces TaxID=2593676 RepID=UPI00226DCCAD|nr:hypothetical protein [Streptomyces sp. H27-H5]MCY0960239.1 hypothetical protein [Streptomyces sp. H27-H5]
MRLRLRATPVGDAILVHPKGRLDERAADFAGGLAHDPQHTLVVVDLPAGVLADEWAAVAKLLSPSRYGSLRLVFGRDKGEDVRTAAGLIANRLGRLVLAPDGALVPTAAGGLFVPGDDGAAWLRFRPGRAAEPDAQRFPKPDWEFAVPARPGAAGARTTVQPVPCGVWLRHTDEGPLLGRGRRAVEAVPTDPGHLLVVLGSPGAPPLPVADVARYWDTVLPGARSAVRFVVHGTLDTPGAIAPGQGLADALGDGVVLYAGLPSGARPLPDGEHGASAYAPTRSGGARPAAASATPDSHRAVDTTAPAPAGAEHRPGGHEASGATFTARTETPHGADSPYGAATPSAGTPPSGRNEPSGATAAVRTSSPHGAETGVGAAMPSGADGAPGGWPGEDVTLPSGASADGGVLGSVSAAAASVPPLSEAADAGCGAVPAAREADGALPTAVRPAARSALPRIRTESVDSALPGGAPADPAPSGPGTMAPTPAASVTGDPSAGVSPHVADGLAGSGAVSASAPVPPQPSRYHPAPVQASASGPAPGTGPVPPQPSGHEQGPDAGIAPGTGPRTGSVHPQDPEPALGAGAPAVASARLVRPAAPRFRLESSAPAPEPDAVPAGPAAPVAGPGPAVAAPPAAAPGEAAGVRVQPVPRTVACALPPERGIAQERDWVRRTFSEQYNAMAGSVSRVMSESPGLRGGSRAEAADALTELVAVRLYLSGDSRTADAAVRTATAGPHVPLARCVTAGLRRLPSYRGPALLRTRLTDAERSWYREGRLAVEWAFCHARTSLHAGPRGSGATDVLIWSMTARRTSSLDPAVPDRVLFLPGTAFKVLRTDDDTVLMREVSPSEIGQDGRVGAQRAQFDEMALKGLENILDALAKAGTDAGVRSADPPGLIATTRTSRTEGAKP